MVANRFMMKKTLLFIACLLAFPIAFNAQNKELSLEEIWNWKFYPEQMNSLNSMNGDFYSLLNIDRQTRTSSVDKYSYKTLEKIKTIVDGKNLKDLPFFEFYSFNKDESKLILGTDFKQIYRRSKKGTYYVYDIYSKKLTLIDKEIQEPTFSPDNKKIAYTKNNNIFIKDFSSNELIEVTKDGKINKIINGTTDWVYEEEFAFVRAYEWSKDGKNLAYLKFDETKVPYFSMDVYGEELYPTQQIFKYPKAGEKNSKVELLLFNLESKKTKKIDVADYEYIPRIQWTNNDDYLSVTTLNRHQNDLKLFFVNAKTGNSKLILNEKDPAYVDVQDNLTFLEDNSFIWTSEQNGFNHIYLYNNKGRLVRQITKGKWEVTKYYGLDKDKNQIYYQSVENGSINRGVYSININGKNKQLLTPKSGQSSASFSKNLKYFINSYSSVNTAPTFSLYYNNKKVKTILDNKALEQKLKAYKISKKEFSTININGNELNMWMIKPADFNPNKKYPLLLFQYSGPGSQQVANKWNSLNDYWHQLLAQKGMIIACADGRGTGLKGRDFKKITQYKLGKYEVEDQIALAKKLSKLPYINSKNIGIWGWSYGGFMSTNCILKGNDIFSTAIAVAPVTSWRFYDTIYTERYMTTPQENPKGYDENSPLNFANLLKGKYLIIHGTSDDNVHIQNATRMINALIKANKDFDSELYPDRAHGIYKGKNTRLHLFRKMTKFLETNLLNNNN